MNATPVFPISFVLPVVLAVLIICALALQPGKAAATEPDSTPPSISSISVTSDPKDDVGLTIPYRVLSQGKGYKRFPIYAVGDTIQLTVAFDKTINVTGTPQLEFAMGSSIKEASFTSIDGNSLIFEYPVVNGDKDTDGISVKANSLLLNGGTIQSESGTSANLSHDALPAQRGHKVDGIPPTVKTLWIQDGEPVPIEVLGIGDQVIVGIHFSEQVYSSIQGPPQIRLQVGDAERAASFQSEGWGKSFVYFIQEGDLDPDGLSVKANSIDLNGGFIKDRAGNPLVLSNPAKNYGSKRIRTNEDGSIEVMGPVDVDGIRPVVDSLAIISDPGNDKTYEAGDVVKVSVNFSEPMTVPETGGVWHGKRFTSVPSLFLNIGGTERRAWFENVDGNSVIFAYTIQDDDQDSDGISIGANKLTVKHEDKELQHPLIVALIRDRPDTKVGVNDADLTHSALADNPSHLVGEASEQQKQRTPTNQPPTVSGTLADVTIVNESGTKRVSLSGVFSDTDADALTITAASSDEAKATVSVAGDYSTLTVTAKARGTATVTVTAADGNGGTVDDSFTVKVKAAPVVAQPLGDVIDLEPEETHTVSMSGVFSDADGDAVTVTEASSSDTSIAAVSAAIDGATAAITAVTVTAGSEGTATITVTARDADGNTVSDAFD
ncbi:MAG: Ig-like domain-containing protein, partial [Chloroflexi bacterium]|nr:Ig-like domain-containing protein [Chloroflexota bacterium]